MFKIEKNANLKDLSFNEDQRPEWKPSVASKGEINIIFDKSDCKFDDSITNNSSIVAKTNNEKRSQYKMDLKIFI